MSQSQYRAKSELVSNSYGANHQEILTLMVSSLIYGQLLHNRSPTQRSPKSEQLKHPIHRMVAQFAEILYNTYEPLRDQSLQQVILRDIQDFIKVSILILRFFYRRCILTDNMQFIDSVVESLTHLFFTCNNGYVYKLLRSIFQQDHQVLTCQQIQYLSSIKLTDLKLDIKESDALWSTQIKLAMNLHKYRDPRLLLVQITQLSVSIAQNINSIRGLPNYVLLQEFDLVQLLTLPEWHLATSSGIVSTDELLAGMIYVLLKAKSYFNNEGEFMLKLIQSFTLSTRQQRLEQTLCHFECACLYINDLVDLSKTGQQEGRVLKQTQSLGQSFGKSKGSLRSVLNQAAEDQYQMHVDI